MATTSRPSVRNDVQRQREIKREDARNELRRRHPGLREVIVEFQPDAVEIEQQSIPGGARWTLYVVFGLIVAICLWAYFSEVDRIVTAQGKLVVDQTYVIQPPQAAPVKELNVRFGQEVRRGDLLARLDPTFPDADVNQLQSKLETFQAAFERLKCENERREFSILGHELDPAWTTQLNAYLERRNEYQAKTNEFASEQLKLEIKTANNKTKLQAEEEVLVVLKSLAEKKEGLADRRHATEIEREDSRLQVTKKVAEIATLNGEAKEIAAESRALADRRAAYEASWRAEVAKEMAGTYQQIAETQQQLNKATRAQEYVDLFVPNDLPFEKFYVMEVADRSVGSVVQTGEPLVKLTPIDSPLELEVKLNDKDIGMIEVGQTVRIKLTTLPYQRHGFLSGTIRTISEGAIEKPSAAVGVPPELIYVARIVLTDETELRDLPEAFRLRPGLMADAEILVGRRRVYEYFLYPLLKALDSSIREP